jgi:xanthine dehydrogenase accessory factor
VLDLMPALLGVAGDGKHPLLLAAALGLTPAEVAVSITAELVASRTRSARGLSLKHGSGPIHQHAGHGHTAAPPARTLQARTLHARTLQNQETPWT